MPSHRLNRSKIKIIYNTNIWLNVYLRQYKTTVEFYRLIQTESYAKEDLSIYQELLYCRQYTFF